MFPDAPPILITPTTLEIPLTLGQRALTLHFYDLHIPLHHIAKVAPAPDLSNYWLGFRVGAHLPHVITAGTFYHLREKADFIYVKDTSRAIRIELVPGAAYRSVILEVPPEKRIAEAIEEIQAAIEAYDRTYNTKNK
ncbi:hypothetical protein BC832DRAFT_456224 [Gaertneriomyces semiglobifer]|nr:hypothetical protein BC832DRAFT_456224 [Gaertneriomyces semiglobifer]